MKKYFILFGLILLSLSVITVKAQNYLVRSTIYWTSPVMSEREAKCVSYYSVAIIDGENMVNNPEAVRLIKRLNSSIKLICYSNPMELFSPMVSPRPMQAALAKEILEKYPQWILKTSSGQNVVFYPKMIMLNLSLNCPRINGKNCIEFLAKKQLEILKDTLVWNGYFMDNAGGNISWVNNRIDSDNNKIADDSTSIDRAWYGGISSYASLIKKGMRKGNLLIGNKGSLDFVDLFDGKTVDLFDGKTFENWPNDHLGGTKDWGWHKCMTNARHTGAYTIFLVKSKDLMFGLASALLTDNVYIGVGQDNPTVHPEFMIDLGKPLSQAGKNDSCYFRLYEKGKVEVFPSKRMGRITMKK